MDEMAYRFKDLELGFENGVATVEQPLVGGGFAEGSDSRVSGGVYAENSRLVTGQESKDAKESKLGKEKRKSLGHKKPPRPPRAPSLDAADQKLIREIAEFARLKRARIERMKALKKSKDAKPTSSSTSSNMFAMVFTVIFCLVILFQGMSSGGTPPQSYQGSPLPAGAVQGQGGPSTNQFTGNPSASFPNQNSESPYLVEQVAGLEGEQKQGRFSG